MPLPIYLENNLDVIQNIEQGAFNLTSERQRAERLGLVISEELSHFLNERGNIINRNDVIGFISSRNYSRKDELILILFWGLYFTVIQRGPKTMFIEWLNEIAITELETRVNAIQDACSDENRAVENLFRSFENQYKIPGLGYAYFTKLFYFYSVTFENATWTFPILDKWLSVAWVNLAPESVNFYTTNNQIENYLLKRQKPVAYSQFTLQMREWAIELVVSVTNLETFLFGWDLNNNEGDNPRTYFLGLH